MGKLAHLLWLACLVSCGSGGGGSGDSSSDTPQTGDSLTGNLVLLSHVPAQDAVQVAVDAPISLSFDAAVVAECLQDQDTWLRTAAGANVPGTFSQTDSGRTVLFRPDTPLEESTDYEFQVAPLTCDSSGRILEVHRSFAFRTLDTVPPTFASSSVQDGATNTSRTSPIVLTFNEALDPASVVTTSVYLRDDFGTDHPVDLAVADNAVQVAPAADLAGNRTYILVARGGNSGVADRAGNRLGASVSLRFRTQVDATPPRALRTWPDGGVAMSPILTPHIVFDESIDPFSVEPSSLAFLDEFGNLVPYAVDASRDRKTLRLRPEIRLTPGRGYRIALLTGLAGITDVSGNAIAGSPVVLQWTTGTDETPPAILQAQPADGATSVSLTAQPLLNFDGGLDPDTVSTATVILADDLGTLPTTVALQNLDTRLIVVPTYDLDPGTTYTLTLRGGDEGLKDKAGNPLLGDSVYRFTSTLDATAPTVMLQPGNGATAIPTDAVVSAIFDAPLDPLSVHAGTVYVRDQNGAPVVGAVTTTQGDRVVVFTPQNPWLSGITYTATFRGGVDGIRETSGNTLRQDATTSFRTGFTDNVVPDVTLTLNATDSRRTSDLTLPTWGFTFDVFVADDIQGREDMGNLELIVRSAGTGSNAGPASAVIYETAEIDRRTFRWRVPFARALPAGRYTAQAIGHDLSGNAGHSEQLSFEVAVADNRLLPFERTQVVWVRTDLDRDGTGTPDFDDDLLRLGLIAAGDPAGTNAWMRQTVLQGILAQANGLFGRSPTGAPLDTSSVALRLSSREPLGVAHMQMALGGFDPEGSRGRTFGTESTGVLGRALYDYRNSTVNERNIAQSPGLGVFPGEMFLYQSRIHLQVFPGFLTTFARKFINLAPDMGGRPAGTDPLDATVLAAGFDYTAATAPQRARFDQVLQAADDWASVIGVILAHEIGHSVGLVAPGHNSASGLHGDSSLHNEFSTLGEVMASSVGYDAMVSVAYGFRDLNAAYLRQRLLLR